MHAVKVSPRQVRLELLDGFALRVDGQAIELPLGPQRLLAYLALQAKPLLRSAVAASLWLETTDDRAAASLRSTLWRVRRAAGDVIANTGTSLSLCSEVWVDVQDAVSQARGILADINAEVDVGLMARDLLPDWLDDWVLVDRERLRQLRIHALERLAEQACAAGQYARAVEGVLAALAAEPLRETAHRLLIELDIRQGNRADAIGHYRDYERLMADELGLPPAPAIRALVDRLLR